MPGFLLHAGATVLCTHGGQVQPTVVQPRVTVSGQPVVTLGPPWVVAGCALPPPPAANGPCLTAQFVTSSARVLVMGLPVLLFDSQAVCAPTGTPVIVAMTQTRAIGS
jgi:hypothetical protein